MDKQAKRQTDTQTVIHIHEQKNIEQVDGQTVGWTYRQIEKWTDIETHEQYFMKY